VAESEKVAWPTVERDYESREEPKRDGNRPFGRNARLLVPPASIRAVPGALGQPGGESRVSPLCHDRQVSPTATGRAKRIRLDQALVDRGLVETRSRAQALILAGKVRVGEGDSARLDRKAGDLVDDGATISIDHPEPYVSRGGHKLATALDAFGIDPAGLTALDVGASTGGFTDVLLQRGARHVYAVDVGRGQLAESLRRDARVTSMERTNARTLTAMSLPEPIDLAVIDVSFISLDKVLGPITTTLAPKAPIVALVKPQFEAGKGRTDHGVVRDAAIHREVLERVVAAAAQRGLGTRAVIASPILGPDGNREFLVHLAAGPSCAEIPDLIADVTAP
jgi:23S rRNA (cytidine1920-2'-O)/16S rRNA (cytidine1409-2'-O)-methyltransferase